MLLGVAKAQPSQTFLVRMNDCVCVFFCFLIFAHYSASFIRLKAAAITIENAF